MDLNYNNLDYNGEMSDSDTNKVNLKAPQAPAKGKESVTSNDFCLDHRDPGNFLKLAAVLKLFLADSLTDADIDEADRLVCEYNIELIEVCWPIMSYINTENLYTALWCWHYQTKPPLLYP